MSIASKLMHGAGAAVNFALLAVFGYASARFGGAAAHYYEGASPFIDTVSGIARSETPMLSAMSSAATLGEPAAFWVARGVGSSLGFWGCSIAAAACGWLTVLGLRWAWLYLSRIIDARG